MTQAYPLQWPAGMTKTPSYKRERSRFSDSSSDRSLYFLLDEIRRLGGGLAVVSTNIRVRKDGLPYAEQKLIEDPGVAVYFMLKNEQRSFACDRWDRVHDNMKAIAKTIEALRGIERWGSSDMVDQAFRGFVALPSNKRAWYDVLQCRADASPETVNDQYKRLAMDYHPDRPGGSPDKMAELNAARDEALAARA